MRMFWRPEAEASCSLVCHDCRGPRSLGERSADGRSLGADAGLQELSTREAAVAEPLLRAVTARLGFLIDVGLD